MDLLREHGAFLLVSVALGGGAAWLAGRAVAQTWRPLWQGMLYMFVLGAAVRFVHFALFDGTLTDPIGYARDTFVVVVFAAVGFKVRRRHQMAQQYAFLTATGAAVSMPAPWKADMQDSAPSA